MTAPRIVAAACVATLTLVPAAAASTRGDLVRATPVAHLSTPATVRAVHRWREEDGLRLDTATVRDGVDAFRIVYRTVGPDGRTPTTASGLVAVPQGRPSTPLRIVEWEHGTTVAKADAPSTGASSDARLTALLFAGSGFATVAPDYLGLGVGPGRHPFDDRRSETTASVDMLAAARDLLARGGTASDPRVFVAGFSQGGKVALSVGDALQHGALPGVSLAAQAGISGPYDIAGAQVRALPRLDPLGVAFYLAYSAQAWGLDPHAVYRRPFARTVPPLFDGRHEQRRVFAGLAPYRKVFRPGFLRHVERPTGGLARRIAASDGACRWAPAAPTRLFGARADEQVAFANSRHCRADLAAHGVDVRLTDLGHHGHFGSAILATTRVLRWFEALA